MSVPPMGDPSINALDTFTLAELQRMRDAAWREAARCWQEYRAWPLGSLLTAADEAERYWHLLKHATEERERATEEQED